MECLHNISQHQKSYTVTLKTDLFSENATWKPLDIFDTPDGRKVSCVQTDGYSTDQNAVMKCDGKQCSFTIHAHTSKSEAVKNKFEQYWKSVDTDTPLGSNTQKQRASCHKQGMGHEYELPDKLNFAFCGTIEEGSISYPICFANTSWHQGGWFQRERWPWHAASTDKSYILNDRDCWDYDHWNNFSLTTSS